MNKSIFFRLKTVRIFQKIFIFTLLPFLLTTSSAFAVERQSVEYESWGKVIVSGQVEMSNHTLKNKACGYIKMSPGRHCGEIWFDWRTKPHKHYDAYVVRTCSSGGWGKWQHKDGLSNIPITGVRAAVCVVKTRGSRDCSADWVYDSIRAGTYSVENL